MEEDFVDTSKKGKRQGGKKNKKAANADDQPDESEQAALAERNAK